MPLDDDVRALLAADRAAGEPALWEVSVQEVRFVERRRHQERRERTPVARVADRLVDGPGGALPLRIYAPELAPPRPLLVYLHGGGFVLGDLDTHDEACRRLCRGSGSVVVSVAYRLAPEAPFPAAVDDAEHATRWARRHAEELGARADRIVVAGDSAGGNLAAVTARRLRDAGGPPLAGQLLVYPVTDLRPEAEAYPSRAEHGEGFGLTARDMAWFAEQYLPSDGHAHDPDASPILADRLADLPRTLVVTAEFDPLRDEGSAYARRLAEAGVEVEYLCLPGTIHGILTRLERLVSQEEAWRRVLGWLRETMAADASAGARLGATDS